MRRNQTHECLGGNLARLMAQSAKALGQEWAWCVGGTMRKPRWLEQSERVGEREEGRAGR